MTTKRNGTLDKRALRRLIAKLTKAMGRAQLAGKLGVSYQAVDWWLHPKRQSIPRPATQAKLIQLSKRLAAKRAAHKDTTQHAG